MPTNSPLPCPVLTLDGPSGVGKGSIAKQLAQLLNWHLLDSGALYRCFAWLLLHEQRQYLLDHREKLQVFLTTAPIQQRQQRYYWRQQDISKAIRTERISQFTSQIASNEVVRQCLLPLQRQTAQMPGLIADGRDMGTVVFADAPYKVYLTATPTIRAKRRLQQLQLADTQANLRKIMSSMQQRDQQDAQRAMAPLKAANDAWQLDNSTQTLAQTCNSIIEHFKLTTH